MLSLGKEIEKLVSVYLIEQGLQLICTNYRCKTGEIDLIMREQEILVFVEVRYRRFLYYGGGKETINKHKQRRLLKTALYYLQKNKLYDKTTCRFDVVAVSGMSRDNICWIRNAFWEKW